jgi:hypothetical protein
MEAFTVKIGLPDMEYRITSSYDIKPEWNTNIINAYATETYVKAFEPAQENRYRIRLFENHRLNYRHSSWQKSKIDFRFLKTGAPLRPNLWCTTKL